jgi:hypothetical protein
MRKLRFFWTPVTLSRRKPGTGVTTCYEIIRVRVERIAIKQLLWHTGAHTRRKERIYESG